METVEKGIIFSYDIDSIMKGKNALKFNYNENGLLVPDKTIIENVRRDFEKDAKNTYNTDVVIVSEEEMKYYMNKFIDMYRGYFPIVSMDEIYVDCDNRQVFSLDCTRLTGSKELISRLNPLDKNNVKKQVKKLADKFKRKDINQVVLADDVVFSGSVIKQISDMFLEQDVFVVGVLTAISTEDAYIKYNKEMMLGLKCGYLMKKEVIDEICERDFYYGIAQSGMSKLVDGKIYKAPYFLPFGDPIERASVPEDKADYFSKSCIERSLVLLEEMQNRSKKTIYNYDLPEPILNTELEEEAVKTLRKVR